MNRILEFSPSQEEAVVARILVLVHQAVDTHFPSAEQANRQFTKTVFSGEGERTAGLRAAVADDDDGEKTGAFGSDEMTSPTSRPADSVERPYIPPPPGRPAGAFGSPPHATGPGGPAPSDRALGFASGVNPLAIGVSDVAGGRLSKSTRLDTTIDEMRSEVGLDWTMRLTLAALVAGFILFFYFLYRYINLG